MKFVSDFNTFLNENFGSINEGFGTVANPKTVGEALLAANSNLYRKLEIDPGWASDGGGPGKGYVLINADAGDTTYNFFVSEGNAPQLKDCVIIYREKPLDKQSGLTTADMGVKTKFFFGQFVEEFKKAKDVASFCKKIIGQESQII